VVESSTKTSAKFCRTEQRNVPETNFHLQYVHSS